MKPELKKLLVLNLPYLLFVYLFAKCGQAYRLAAGVDASAKLLHLTGGISAATAPTTYSNISISFIFFVDDERTSIDSPPSCESAFVILTVPLFSSFAPPVAASGQMNITATKIIKINPVFFKAFYLPTLGKLDF